MTRKFRLKVDERNCQITHLVETKSLALINLKCVKECVLLLMSMTTGHCSGSFAMSVTVYDWYNINIMKQSNAKCQVSAF